MCGIVGLYLKEPTLQPQLGALFEPMLAAMADRGPDSAGFARYGDEAPEGTIKFTLQSSSPTEPAKESGQRVAERMEAMRNVLDQELTWTQHAEAIVLRTDVDEQTVKAWLREQWPEATVMSVGRRIEIYKGVGHPRIVARRHGLAGLGGSHMIGHTRMATESGVTLCGSHPFTTGRDLCLVHNGSLSNHNTLRRRLQYQGHSFETDNDSEVAATYLAWRLQEGDTLTQALEGALVDLDGFFTFTVGTRDGFAVVRDPIACKPAVMAENDALVAVASEYRALAHLPDIENAAVWEPKPARIFVWEQGAATTLGSRNLPHTFRRA